MAETTQSFVIPLSNIVLPKEWNREGTDSKQFKEGINSLAVSLKTVGQVSALTVEPTDKKDKFLLVDGRRRYMALKDAGIDKAVVSFTNSKPDVSVKAKSIAANLNRLGHSTLELATVFKDLSVEGIPHQDIAKMCEGVTPGRVSQYIKLLELPENVQEDIRSDLLSFSQARVLCRFDLTKDSHAKKVSTLWTKATQGMSAQDMEAHAQAFFDREKAKAKAKEDKAKGKKKEGKKSEASSQKKETKSKGRPQKTKDYAELSPQIKPVNKTTLVSYLQANEERLVKSSSKLTQRYLKGVRDGLELAAGLRE